MKINFSLPKDTNFFNRYATLVPTMHKLGYIAQVVSALTEIGIIYSLIYSGLVDFFPAFAHPAAIAGAILGTAFIEIGNRKFTPYGVRAILYRRFARLDLVMSIFILAMAAGLLVTSGVLSFRGSRTMVAAVAPTAEQHTTEAADSAYAAASGDAKSLYLSDSANIAGRYAGLIAAARAEADSKAGIEQARIKRYEALEQTTGKSHITQKQRRLERIASTEADRDKQIADLELKRSEELAAAMSRRQSAVDAAQAEHGQAKAEVKKFNKNSQDEVDAMITSYGYGLAWFTIICLIGFVFSVVLHEVHKKGASIEEIANPTQYDFQDSWMAQLSDAVGNRLQYLVRSRIQAFDQKTPPPPLPLAPAELYDASGISGIGRQVRLELQSSQAGNQVIYLPVRRAIRPDATGTPVDQTHAYEEDMTSLTKYDLADRIMLYIIAAHDCGSKNYHEPAADLEAKAEAAIRAYLAPINDEISVLGLKQKVFDWVNKVGPNPFDSEAEAAKLFDDDDADEAPLEPDDTQEESLKPEEKNGRRRPFDLFGSGRRIQQ